MRKRPSLSLRRRLCNNGAAAALWASALLCCALLLFLTGYIFYQGLPGISWDFLTGAESILQGTAGILPAIVNTLYVLLLSLAIALPLGAGAAIYLTEYARNRRLVEAVEFAAEILSGIPSILYALVGMILFCTVLRLQKTLLAGSLTLAIMILPTILRTTQESLKAVPRSYREGALGLGAGQWRMIRTVVLPSAADGIASGCILAAGRVAGESAVLMYTAGLSTVMQDFSTVEGLMKASGSTLTVALYVYAKERADFAAAFAVAAVLLALAALLNLAAGMTAGKVKERKGTCRLWQRKQSSARRS